MLVVPASPKQLPHSPWPSMLTLPSVHELSEWIVVVISDAGLATSDTKSKQDLEPQAAKHKGSGNGTSSQQRWQKKVAASAC